VTVVTHSWSTERVFLKKKTFKNINKCRIRIDNKHFGRVDFFFFFIQSYDNINMTFLYVNKIGGMGIKKKKNN
jgi:hypothetical protein